jgi:TQXA domain-containing protein
MSIPRVAKIACGLLGAAVTAGLLAGARPAAAATACLTGNPLGSPATGVALNGSIGTGTGCPTPSGTHNVGYAGTFNIQIDGGAATLAYCVDLTHPIGASDCEPQVPTDYPCEVTYILSTYYPNAAVPGGLTTAEEAAAVQAAIWHFTDCYTVTGPSNVATRAAAIIADAEAHGTVCDPPTAPHSISIAPPAATNVLPTQSTHAATATVLDTVGAPVVGSAITVQVTGVSGPYTFNGTTDANGQYPFSYANTFLTAGVDNITAAVSFTTPLGLKFKVADKQGIVIAGAPRTGSVTGTATKTWVEARCGDGVKNQPAEQCDDGNLVNGDGCDANCTPTSCGNGIVTAGEQCDDGNTTSGDGCDANCKPTGCGNGVVTAGESCDDGNQVNGDGCDQNCKPTGCGNGIVTAGEECDDGNLANGDTCEADCTLPRCGNGVVDAGEQCDDGNTAGGDACEADCMLPLCGNGVVDAGEQCDDGNQVSGDACEPDCTTPRCGNGIVDAGEQCDDGNVTNADACEADCTLPTCGNGILDGFAGEQCDDGNTTSGDGCSATCRGEEICNNLLDDDHDGLIDCDDTSCPACPLFERDPAAIVFRKLAAHDKFKVHGRVVVDGPVDFLTQPFGILLTNANGVIYRGELQPGDLKIAGGGGGGSFVDKAAATGAGSRDGLAKVRIVDKGAYLNVTLLAFGDLRAATLPTMGVQVLIGGRVAYYKSEWRQTGSGWVLKLPPVRK